MDITHWLTLLENRHPQAIQLGLARVTQVARALDLLHPPCPVITVAGTNGKGSTVAALEAIYHQAGYTVGAYTSPHLLRFNERIRVNRQPITDESLCAIFSRLETARASTVLTYFEMTTLAALWHFKQQPVEVMVLEVGLGGRLDATNLLPPSLAIITTIDFDHQEFLGHTREAIGYEKAGILRPGIPFIYADTQPPTSVLQVAQQLQVDAYVNGQGYTVQATDTAWDLQHPIHGLHGLPKPTIHLQSAAAAVLASQLLQDLLPVHRDDVCNAMHSVFIPGRQQLVPGVVRVLYDVSHNPQSVRLLAQKVAELKNNGAVHAVFSALHDKDIPQLISPMKAHVNFWYPAKLDSARATPAQTLIAHLENAAIDARICYNTPFEAFEAALRQAKPGDLIIVYGSFLTVSQVMSK